MAWLKKWGWIILVGIAAVLAALLGIKYERDKVNTLKRQAIISKAKADISKMKIPLAVKKAKEEVYSEIDDATSLRIKKMEKCRKESRLKDEGATAQEIADELNKKYR